MNSVPLNIPRQFDGDVLNEWLGIFWTRMCYDHGVVKSYMNGQGLLSMQMALEFIEAVSALELDKCPIFHRSRWMPLIVRKSEKGTGKAVSFRVGVDPPVFVGPQPENSEYQYGAIYKVGGYAQPRSFVSYPIHGSIHSVAACICDSISDPSVVLVNGKDFYVESDTLLIKSESDMFDNPKFSRRILALPNGGTDEEIILWAIDALVDRNLLYNHFGYAVGISLPSSEFYSRVLSTLWKLYVTGGPEAFMKACLAAMLGLQAISSDETVKAILTDFATDDILIVTDKAAYRYPPGTTVSSNVKVGTELSSGTIPVDTIKVFSRLSSINIGASRLEFESAVPMVHIPQSMLSVPVKFGLSASWTISPVVFHGIDTNGYPKLSLTLSGDPDDIELFWTEMFRVMELKGINLVDLIPEVGNMEWASLAIGQSVGFASPAKFIVDNFIGPNSMFVVIDLDHVADRSALPHLSKINNMAPIGSHIFIHMRMGVQELGYDMSDKSVIVNGDTSDTDLNYRYTGSQSDVAGIAGSMLYRDSSPRVRYKVICGDL